MSQLKKLTIKGFKSIRSLENLELRQLNVLIGANSAGKSNFIAFFKLLNELIEGRLQTPEHINDSPETAPSKRLLKLFPRYDKPAFGSLAVGRASWLDKLEKPGASSTFAQPP